VKAQGVVNYPPELLFLVFGDEKNKKLYDESYDEGYLIEKFAD
jgi:hypothetical protein